MKLGKLKKQAQWTAGLFIRWSDVSLNNFSLNKIAVVREGKHEIRIVAALS